MHHVGSPVTLPNIYTKTRKSIRAPYEDVRKSPSAPLLAELDVMEFVLPRSHSVIDEYFKKAMFPPTSEPPPLSSELEDVRNVGDVVPPSRPEASATREEAANEASLPNLESPGNPTDISEFREEEALWAS